MVVWCVWLTHSCHFLQVIEENAAVVYYTTENALVYHEREVQSAEFPLEMAEGIEYLITATDFVTVASIPGIESKE